MASFKFVICSNNEILLEQYDGLDRDAVSEAVGAAFRYIESRLDCTRAHENIDTDRFFRNWNGGRYDQFWCRTGFVAVNIESHTTREIALGANEVIHEALRRLQLEWYKMEIDLNCQFIADPRTDSDECRDYFEEIMRIKEGMNNDN